MDNKLIDLISAGLSWSDSVAATELARLLDQGKTEIWREEVESSVKSNGLPRTLHRIALSYKELNSWGTFLRVVLELFNLSELYGLACNPFELVKRVAEEEPSSWSKSEELAHAFAVQYLKKQIESGDVYLLKPSKIISPDFSIYVPHIIEKRKNSIEGARPYLTKDGLIDMFDFLELPIAMDLMIKSGVGGRASSDKAKEVLGRLFELGLIKESTPVAERPDSKLVNPESQYLRLYSDCLPHQRDLLRGAAMALDPDETLSMKGLEMIGPTGHPHSREPLLFALENDNEAIKVQAIKGLSILRDYSSSNVIAKCLESSSREQKIAATKALGRLRASEYFDVIDENISVNDDEIQIASMLTLLRMNTSQSLSSFWKNYRRFGMIRLSPFSKDIADTHDTNAIHFLVNLMMLDLHSFVESGEIHMYNALIQAKEGAENKMMNFLLDKLREQTIGGFGRLGDTAVPVLTTLLKLYPETSHLVKAEVEWNTSEQEMQTRMTWRIQQYHRLPSSDKIPNPVEEIIKALGVTHSRRAIPVLKDLCRADDERIVLLALEALGEIDIPALDAIIEVPESSSNVRMKKLRELGTIVHPKVTEWLIEQSRDEEPLVRMQSAIFLAMRNDASLSKHLMRLAKDKNAAVRAGLANIISRLGMETYPEIMNRLSKDQDEVVRNTIAKARVHFQADAKDDFWA